MSGSMSSMVRSRVREIRDGADAVSHTMGDVLDDIKSRVDDLVVVAHPSSADVRWRRRGGLLLVVVLVVAGAWFVRKRMLRTSTTGASRSTPSRGSAVGEVDKTGKVDAVAQAPVDSKR